MRELLVRLREAEPSSIAGWLPASGGEHGWSLFRTDAAPDASNRKQRDEAFARPNAGRRWRRLQTTTDAWLSDMGNSCDQTSRWQKRAAISEKIFEREIMSRRTLRPCAFQPCTMPRSIAGLLYLFD